MPLQPRRLMIPAAAVGCEPMLRLSLDQIATLSSDVTKGFFEGRPRTGASPRVRVVVHSIDRNAAASQREVCSANQILCWPNVTMQRGWTMSISASNMSL